MNIAVAQGVLDNAGAVKASLRATTANRRERVPIRSRLDRDEGRLKGASPDRAIVQEIDPEPKPVFFDWEV
jgi:hypothetical protein